MLIKAKTLKRYKLYGLDREIGKVKESCFDDQHQAIRYLIINTKNWWPGKKVLVSPKRIERVSWSESKVYVNLTLENIKQSPEYTEKSLLTRDYETTLHKHYNRQGYWFEDQTIKKI